MDASSRNVLVCSLLCAAILTCVRSSLAGTREPDRGFALVELFTSEGCSSCPPADALLGRIVSEAEREHRPIYALSFHVDYWDHLGWRDRFSSAVFTRRQDGYARRFGLASLYTPQLVVNGEHQCVGSDEAAARGAIRDGLAHEAPLRVGVEVSSSGSDVVAVYSVARLPPGAVLSLAWVDEQATSAPDRGENSGRTLHHVSVVRDLRSVTPGQRTAGTMTLHRPEHLPGRVIAWVQAEGAGRVLGASASERLGP